MWENEFDPEELKREIYENHLSPKIRTLLEIIKDLDKQDLETDKKLYKHAIFCSSDRPSGAAGPLAVGCCLEAVGFKWAQTTRMTLDEDVLMERHPYKFAILTTKSFETHEKGKSVKVDGNAGIRIKQLIGEIKSWCDMSAEEKKLVQSGHPLTQGVFNDRYLNVYGQKIRFILFDKKFVEGVDFFDGKYIHILTPQGSVCLTAQALGRVQRFCGMAGLDFVPKAQSQQGWNVTAFVYRAMLHDPVEVENGIKIQNTFQLAQYYSTNGENPELINTFLNLIAQNAIDKLWTEKINPPIQKYGEFGKYRNLHVFDVDGNYIGVQNKYTPAAPKAAQRTSEWEPDEFRTEEDIEEVKQPKKKPSRFEQPERRREEPRRRQRFDEDEEETEPLEEEKPRRQRRFDEEESLEERRSTKPRRRHLVHRNEEEEEEEEADNDFEAMLCLPHATMKALQKKSISAGETVQQTMQKAKLPTIIASKKDLTTFRSQLKRLPKPRKGEEHSFNTLDPETRQTIKNLCTHFDCGSRISLKPFVNQLIWRNKINPLTAKGNAKLMKMITDFFLFGMP